MKPRALYMAVVFMLGMAVGSVWQPWQGFQVSAQAGCQTFKETGKTVCGKFLTYWNTHGGLAQQGYPISNTFQEKSELDGKTHTVQYFERAVFELHPENQAPYDVLLSQLGTFQFKARYPKGDPSGSGLPAPPASGEPGVGSSQELDGIKVTLNSVRHESTGLIAPEAGMEYVIVNIAYENVSAKSQQVASFFNLKVKDDTGQTYTPGFGATKADDATGTLAVGDKLQGESSFDVPKTAKGLYLLYSPLTGQGQIKFKLDR